MGLLNRFSHLYPSFIRGHQDQRLTLSTVEKNGTAASSLSAQLERAGTILQNGTLEQIESYKSRFATIEGLYDRLFKDILVTQFNSAKGRETAVKFFGADRVPFAAVDGTEYVRPLFDLVVFFGGSYAAKGTVTYRENGLPAVEYEDHFLQNGRALSSCVPVYVNEVPDIDQSFIQPGEISEISLVRPLTDEAIANNSTVPAWIMTFSEFYLAYKLATEPDGPQIILMDRSFATTLASLIYDTSRRKLWRTNGALYGYEIDGQSLDENDLAYARHRVYNAVSGLPPARGDYLRYACLLTLEQYGHLSGEKLCEKLKIGRQDQQRRVERFLKRSATEGYLESTREGYRLKERYRQTWPRIRKLVDSIGHRMFEEKPRENPMKLWKKGEPHWMTTQDLAFLTLFTLNMLIEEAWRKPILLIGVTKDTAARDMKNHVLPILVSNNTWPSNISQEDLSRIPNTDRMLLQTLSVFNYQTMPVPWSLVEYDSCFLTTVPDFSKRPGFVSGAIKNKITPERLFLKTYLQLSQTEYDPQLRSNVLLVDRLAYPEFDLRPDTTVGFSHTYGGADEPVSPIIFKNNTVSNPLQNLVMLTLSAMTSNSIPELFGHNKPLFIADKVAKWHYEEMRRIIDTTGKWLMNNPKLRHFVFYMSTFRERRSEIEATRRESY